PREETLARTGRFGREPGEESDAVSEVDEHERERRPGPERGRRPKGDGRRRGRDGREIGRRERREREGGRASERGGSEQGRPQEDEERGHAVPEARLARVT